MTARGRRGSGNARGTTVGTILAVVLRAVGDAHVLLGFVSGSTGRIPVATLADEFLLRKSNNVARLYDKGTQDLELSPLGILACSDLLTPAQTASLPCSTPKNENFEHQGCPPKSPPLPLFFIFQTIVPQSSLSPRAAADASRRHQRSAGSDSGSLSVPSSPSRNRYRTTSGSRYSSTHGSTAAGGGGGGGGGFGGDAPYTFDYFGLAGQKGAWRGLEEVEAARAEVFAAVDIFCGSSCCETSALVTLLSPRRLESPSRLPLDDLSVSESVRGLAAPGTSEGFQTCSYTPPTPTPSPPTSPWFQILARRYSSLLGAQQSRSREEVERAYGGRGSYSL